MRDIEKKGSNVLQGLQLTRQLTYNLTRAIFSFLTQQRVQVKNILLKRAIRTTTGTLAVNYNTVKCYCHTLETENLSLWELYGGKLEGGLLDLKDMLSKALEMSVCFHGGPVLGNMGGSSFPRAFERRVKLSFIRKTFMRNSADK